MPTPNLAEQVADPGFTPGVRLLSDLLDLLGGDETVAKNAERAVIRIEARHASRVAADTATRARAAERPARARLTHLAGRLAHEGRDPDGLLRAWLLEALRDDDVKTRRAAARGLGKLTPTPEIERALAAAFDAEKDARPTGALAMALGKVGGEAARERLGEHGRASMIASREGARADAVVLDPARAAAAPLRIRFHTRSGLEPVVIEELGSRFGEARLAAPGAVDATLDGPLARALEIRTASHVGFPLAARRKSGDLAADIVAALGSEQALATLRAFDTSSQIRFRLAFARGGHRRAIAWNVAEGVRERVPGLLNDPRSSPWEIVVDDAGPQVKIELVPRGAPDERFAYRRELVPASSHPTIAAALARVAPRRDDDVVWDPFVGAGAELVERARLGPYARLLGTDLDAKAVAAARANLAHASIEPARASIEQADALTYRPSGVTLVITNPPMGRRVQRGTHASLLEELVTHAAEVLVPGGALVWLVPEPRPIHDRAAKVGLEQTRAITVDMGGFSAELGVYVKRPPLRQKRPPRRP